MEPIFRVSELNVHRTHTDKKKRQKDEKGASDERKTQKRSIV